MTQDKKPETVASTKKVVQLPANLPLELIPLYDWWQKSGGQFLIQAGIAIILIVAIVGGKQYYSSKVATANQELMKASTTEELEAFVSNYGRWKVGNAARLRLAKSLFDSEKYDEALVAYDTCISKGAPSGFEEVAVLGRALCLEAIGLERLDEAEKAYVDFAAKYPTHFLFTQAKMGQARVLAMKGRKAEATTLLETLKADKNKDPMAELAITQLQGVIARYEPNKVSPLAEQSLKTPLTVPAALPDQTKAK